MSPNNSGIYPQHFVSITKNSKCDVKQHMHCLLQVLLPFLTKRVKFTGETDSSIIFSGKGNPTLISSRDERDRKLLNKFLLCINFIESAYSITKNCVPFYGRFWHPSTGCWSTKKCRKIIQIVNLMNKEWCIVTSTLCVCENITPLQLISTSVQETLKKSIKSLNFCKN